MRPQASVLPLENPECMQTSVLHQFWGSSNQSQDLAKEKKSLPLTKGGEFCPPGLRVRPCFKSLSLGEEGFELHGHGKETHGWTLLLLSLDFQGSFTILRLPKTHPSPSLPLGLP